MPRNLPRYSGFNDLSLDELRASLGEFARDVRDWMEQSGDAVTVKTIALTGTAPFTTVPIRGAVGMLSAADNAGSVPVFQSGVVDGSLRVFGLSAGVLYSAKVLVV